MLLTNKQILDTIEHDDLIQDALRKIELIKQALTIQNELLNRKGHLVCNYCSLYLGESFAADLKKLFDDLGFETSADEMCGSLDIKCKK